MNCPRSSSCLLIFFFFLFHNFCCASIKTESWCSAEFECGNIKAGFPFWGGDRPEFCGHPLLQLNCNKDNTSIIISNQDYNVLHLNQTFNTLRLVRKDLQKSFCDATFTSITLPPKIFQLSTTYKTFTIFYLCESTLHHLSTNTCSGKGLISVYQSHDYKYFCEGFTVKVPTSFHPNEKEFSLSDLESVLKKGFEVKPAIDEKLCQECSSSGGICGFKKTTQVCCNDTATQGLKCSPLQDPSRGGSNALGIGLTCGMLGFIATVGSLVYKVLSSHNKKREISHHLSHHELKALIIPLKHYSFFEVKKITKSFTDIIGKGGFGTVYKGILFDGQKVAVKILKDSNSNGEDFINEITSISQTSHVNIVSLLGFCYEGSNRAIIYEFMENGSLDQFISNKNSQNLEMNTLYGIALGVARGIEYLHYGCKTRIVHFDIKPQNVLLDNIFCPKVSDFRLAKLCKKRESIMSLLDTRGTIGYIAPEVFSKMYGVISHKSDVYSYGMLILEMIGARNKEIEENAASNTSSTYFPDWIYKNIENGEYRRLLGDETSGEDKDIGQKMILVGLWCIQPCPSDRPPMNKVIEMLEGNLDTLQVPPKPLLGLPVTIVSESTIEESLESSNMSAPK